MRVGYNAEGSGILNKVRWAVDLSNEEGDGEYGQSWDGKVLHKENEWRNHLIQWTYKGYLQN